MQRKDNLRTLSLFFFFLYNDVIKLSENQVFYFSNRFDRLWRSWWIHDRKKTTEREGKKKKKQENRPLSSPVNIFFVKTDALVINHSINFNIFQSDICENQVSKIPRKSIAIWGHTFTGRVFLSVSCFRKNLKGSFSIDRNFLSPIQNTTWSNEVKQFSLH